MITHNRYQIPVIGFAGYSGSGKTTLLEKLIKELKKRQLQIAVIKHDRHDFHMDYEGKDTWKFANAGADLVAISSMSKTAMIRQHQEEPPLSDLLDQMENVDLILVEGYKKEPIPKIEIRRSGAEQLPPLPAKQLLAIVSDAPVAEDIPCFSHTDISKLAEYLIVHCLS